MPISKPNVLLVEDSPIMLEMLSEELRDWGYDVETFDLGSPAVERCRTGPADVLVVDLGLPDIDGLEVLKTVRSLKPDLPVIILSAESELELVLGALHEGAFDYVVKDQSIATLESSLRRAAQHVSLVRDNQRLLQDLCQANDELKRINSGLEDEVQARTAELSNHNAKMQAVLDNVSQGLAMVDPTGTLEVEGSAAFAQWFDVPGHPTKFWKVLADHDPGLELSLSLGWQQVIDGFLPLDVALAQIPGRLARNERNFALEVKPLTREGSKLDGALLIVSDLTEQLAAAKREDEQRQVYALFQRLAQDRAGLMQFLDEGKQLLSRVTCAERNVVSGMRALHTLKGNCASYGLDAMATLCHDLETWVAGSDIVPHDDLVAPLASAWAEVERQVTDLHGGAIGSIEVRADELKSVIDSIGELDPQAIKRMLKRLGYEPTEARFRQLANQARDLAKRLGRPEPSIVVEHNDIRVPAQRWGSFWSAFVHVMRNAVDHAVEPAANRRARGKSDRCTLTFRSKQAHDEITIELEDDGPGLNWERLRERATSAGLPAQSHEDLVEALFASGVTTRDEVSSVSGRGVGLEAVRRACEDLGGAAKVLENPGGGTTFACVLRLGDDADHSDN